MRASPMLRRLVPDPFILLLLATLALATVAPASGAAAVGVHWLATASVLLLFFLHGARLSRQAIVQGIGHWRLHLAVLVSTFVLFPLLALGLSSAFPGLLPPSLWTGVLFLAALPSTVQSSIAFTAMAGGNVAAAVAAASASQILGVFLTPVLVGLLIGARGGPPPAGAGEVVLMVLVPFVAGHLCRPLLIRFLDRHAGLTRVTDRSAIVLSVYSAFSDAMNEGLWSRLPLPALAMLFGVAAVILAGALLFTWGVGRLGGFSRADRATILFCGSKKSLLQGVPIARILFSGPDVGLMLVPVMIFHQMQLMVCAWIARHWAGAAPRAGE
jgi:sodium/bile acid cotransporter 7